ncbi:F-box protein ETP2 [Cardamine amara subsp. amara]|uniref:F-box protein ETP2 n=1 Tax=Cardamine amara subsp. amara TaxID=228776 RepID=A0ABD1BWM9_CARAN
MVGVYDKNSVKCLLRFDVATEKSQPVPLPYQRSWYDVLCLSVVRDEKLSVLVQLDDDVFKTEIWVTNKIDESTKVVSWSKVLVLDLSHDLQLTNEGSFLLDEEKKKVMFCEKKYIDETDETKSKDMLYIFGETDKNSI